MKISVEWLKQYVELPATLGRLREDLTMAGLVVEGISDPDGSPVLEVEVTSNRPDCLSHIGVAREIAALYGTEVKAPEIAGDLNPGKDRISYDIEILDPDLCPRYAGLVMDGVTVAPSPDWMQRRLEAAGMRPLNNIVDITNYVLLEMGHPLHAFDFEILHGGRIVVARAADGQAMKTLDGAVRELDSQMLLINDGAGPVAIAGVMGGLESEISDTTRTILIECAYFNPASVRRTSKKLGLSTEASYRFERGADWDDLVPAVGRTCQLVRELAGGRIAGGLKDVYPNSVKPVKITLSRARVEGLLGVTLSGARIEEILGRLNFSLQPAGAGLWEVTCPSYRADMELEADLIEEIARFHGYQNIPTTALPSVGAGIPSPVAAAQNAARQVLRGLGYSEAVNLSFGNDDEERLFPSDGTRAEIRNPLTEETRYMRNGLAAGLVRSVRRNFNFGMSEARLFEIGKVYRGGRGGRPAERVSLGIVGTGSFAGFNWDHPVYDYDFFHIKGVVNALLSGMRTAAFEFVPAQGIPWLNPSAAALVRVGETQVGVLGAVHPSIAEEFKFKQPVYVAELDFEALSGLAFEPVRYEPLPRYPRVERDMSIMVSRDVSYGAVQSGIESLHIPELVAIDLIDVYEGDKIPADKVSMTFRITFLDREKTLTVDRVQSFSDNILTFLRQTYGAVLR
jgi:phenylalanyl-tRNA synthetase beta chain